MAQIVGIGQRCILVGIVTALLITFALHGSGQIYEVTQNQFILRNGADVPIEGFRFQAYVNTIHNNRSGFRKAGVIPEVFGANNIVYQNIGIGLAAICRGGVDLIRVSLGAFRIEPDLLQQGRIHPFLPGANLVRSDQIIVCIRMLPDFVELQFDYRSGIQRDGFTLTGGHTALHLQVKLRTHFILESRVIGRTNQGCKCSKRILDVFCSFASGVICIRGCDTLHDIVIAAVMTQVKAYGQHCSTQTVDIVNMLILLRGRIDDLVLLGLIALDGLGHPQLTVGMVVSLEDIQIGFFHVASISIGLTLGQCLIHFAVEPFAPVANAAAEVVKLEGLSVGHEDYEVLPGLIKFGITAVKIILIILLLLGLQQFISLLHGIIVVGAVGGLITIQHTLLDLVVDLRTVGEGQDHLAAVRRIRSKVCA